MKGPQGWKGGRAAGTSVLTPRLRLPVGWTEATALVLCSATTLVCACVCKCVNTCVGGAPCVSICVWCGTHVACASTFTHVCVVSDSSRVCVCVYVWPCACAHVWCAQSTASSGCSPVGWAPETPTEPRAPREHPLVDTALHARSAENTLSTGAERPASCAGARGTRAARAQPSAEGPCAPFSATEFPCPRHDDRGLAENHKSPGVCCEGRWPEGTPTKPQEKRT